MTYVDELRAASVARDSLLCVGLEPDPAANGGDPRGAAIGWRDRMRRVTSAEAVRG